MPVATMANIRRPPPCCRRAAAELLTLIDNGRDKGASLSCCCVLKLTFLHINCMLIHGHLPMVARSTGEVHTAASQHRHHGRLQVPVTQPCTPL